MTKDEKLQFILDLSSGVVASIVEKINDMPDEWDGHELRRYIADKFDEQVFDPFQRGRVGGYGRSPRFRAYCNECLTRNL